MFENCLTCLSNLLQYCKGKFSSQIFERFVMVLFYLQIFAIFLANQLFSCSEYFNMCLFKRKTATRHFLSDLYPRSLYEFLLHCRGWLLILRQFFLTKPKLETTCLVSFSFGQQFSNKNFWNRFSVIDRFSCKTTKSVFSPKLLNHVFNQIAKIMFYLYFFIKISQTVITIFCDR